MQLIVPFVYEAMIIKPRCRKPVPVAVRDVVTVKIRELKDSDLPTAFILSTDDPEHTRELRWHDNRLWDYARQAGSEDRVLAKDVRESTTKPDYQQSRQPTAAAPFQGFWTAACGCWEADRNPNVRESARWTVLETAQYKEDIPVREWISDNRKLLVDHAESIASHLRVSGLYLFREEREPCYHVQTFGLGHNHGGTCLSVASRAGELRDNEFYADHLDAAIEAATKTATERSDTDSLPIRPLTRIEVLIPEAIDRPYSHATELSAYLSNTKVQAFL